MKVFISLHIIVLKKYSRIWLWRKISNILLNFWICLSYYGNLAIIWPFFIFVGLTLFETALTAYGQICPFKFVQSSTLYNEAPPLLRFIN